MILSVSPTAKDGVAKVDEGTQDDIWKEDGLFESDGVPEIGAFFEQAVVAEFGAVSD